MTLYPKGAPRWGYVAIESEVAHRTNPKTLPIIFHVPLTLLQRYLLLIRIFVNDTKIFMACMFGRSA